MQVESIIEANTMKIVREFNRVCLEGIREGNEAGNGQESEGVLR